MVNNLLVQSTKLISDKILNNQPSPSELIEFNTLKTNYNNNINNYSNDYLEKSEINTYKNKQHLTTIEYLMNMKYKIHQKYIESLRNSTYKTLNVFKTQYLEQVNELKIMDNTLQTNIYNLKDMPLDHFVIGPNGLDPYRNYDQNTKFYRFKHDSLYYDSYNDIKDLPATEGNEKDNADNLKVKNLVLKLDSDKDLIFHKNVEVYEGSNLTIKKGNLELELGNLTLKEGDLNIELGNVEVKGSITSSERIDISGITGNPSLIRNGLIINDGLKVATANENNPNSINGGLVLTGGLNMNNGDILNAGIIQGEATSARYADIAERYTTDKVYPVGTILGFNVNDNSEGTIYNGESPLLGVISDKPGFILNENTKDPLNPPVVLKGKSPVRCIHSISKGMYVYASVDNPGLAVGTFQKSQHYELIGVALNNSEYNNKTDEYITMVKI